MSFGWAAGDILSAVNLLVEIGKALRESGGAASDYQDTSFFLEGLGATLERLGSHINSHAASEDGLGSIKSQVEAVQGAVKSFKAKIDRKFGAELGASGGGGWKRIFSGPLKVEYALFVSKKAKSLQEKIAIPLRSIQISLGIESLSAVSNLLIETRSVGIQARSVGIETRSVVTDLIRNGTGIVKSAVSDLSIETRETRSAISDVLSTVSEIQSDVQTILTASDKELLQKVGAWLSPVSSADDFEANVQKLHQGTCEWIFEKPDFSRWMDNTTDAYSAPLFWISGIPGAGKSYLTTRIVGKLRELYPLAYFYCDSKNEQKRSVLNVLRTWVWQLLKQSPECLAKIAEIFFEGALPSISNMRKALKLLSERETCRRVVYVLDGLDECDPSARCDLFSILPDILNHSRVLIVSRNLHDIAFGISRCGKNVEGFASLQISEADNRNDIVNYIQNAVADMDLGDEALEKTILSTLQKNAKGMFLWARLMIEYLSVPGRSIEEYEKALLDLPQGLDALYGRVLQNLYSNSVTRERSQQLFQWLACALRPLKIGELKEAVAIVLDEEHYQPKKVILKFEDCLRQCCGPLVDIEPDGTVSLIHSSVKEFLLSTPDSILTHSSLFVESAITHVHIARACLTYLCFSEIGIVDVDEDREASFERLRAHFGAWKFLNYATLNWYKHLSLAGSSLGCTKSPEAVQSFRRLYSSQYNTVKWLQLIAPSKEAYKVSITYYFELFSSGTLGLESMFQQWLRHLDGRPRRRFTRWYRFMDSWRQMCPPVLYICAAFDFDALTKQLIGEGGFMQLRDYYGNTLLHAAARADAVKVTKLLLTDGEEGFVRLRNHVGKTVLHEAADADAMEVTKLLLAVQDIGFVNLRDHDERTALHVAAHANAVEVTKLLLEAEGIDCVNLHDLDGNTLLHSAARGDALEVTKLLIAVGARVDARNLKDTSPLKLALTCRSFKVASILIESGALGEYEYLKEEFDTPLTIACATAPENDHLLRTVTLMLDHGATKMINWGGGRLRFTPVGHAATQNSIRLLETLFRYGAAIDAGPATPLLKACERKPCIVVPVLVQAGANIHATDHDGRTSLHKAARVNNYDAARVLLEHGADVNAVAWSDGSLPIHDAVRENHIEQVELLLRHDTKLEIEDASGRTPLEIAIDNNFTEAITLLREARTNASRKGRLVDRNDGQLKATIDPQNRQRPSPHDLFHVYWILTRQLERQLPRSVVAKLTTLARYWLKSDDSRSDYLEVEEHDVGPVYLKSSPIQGHVQQVVFTMESNDQGWSIWEKDRGTFDNSWTWFEVEIFDAQGVRVAVEEHERRLYVNVHGSSKRRKTVVVFGRGLNMRQSRWLENLRPEHSVGIVPYARYPGWMNRVHAARIEIYSTYLLPFHEKKCSPERRQGN